MSKSSAPVLGDSHSLVKLRNLALLVGGGLLAAAAFGATANPTQFFRSYLFGFLFWFGLSMGSFAILMIYHITGGAWGAVIRRSLEAVTRTLPLLALLFVPIGLGVHSLYEWADPHHVEQDALLLHKAPYLNVPFFLGRAVFYFVVWNLLALALNRWSLRQEESDDLGPPQRLETLSRGGLVALGLTFSFAVIDWSMSLEPHWYSTLYGVLIAGGSLLSAMCFMVLITAALSVNGPLQSVVQKKQFHDLGKWMLAFTMLWAYFSMSQFLIMWSANLPEEIPWYLKRMAGGWEFVGLLLILAHFGLPFLLLLSSDLKKNARLLRILAGFILVIRSIEVYWLVAPAFSPSQFVVSWMDPACLLGIGGLWFWFFVGQLRQRALIVLTDPSLPVAEHHA